MVTLLERFFIKDDIRKDETALRRAYGTLSGNLGIVLNLILFGAKFISSILSNSVSVSADAFNNLSDAGSSIIMLLGFVYSGKSADRKHPYGHGRIEYLAGLFVSIFIILMGFELAKSSVDRLIHPAESFFWPATAAILCATIAVKIYMYYYNRRLADRFSSVALRSTALDSLSDCAATSAVLAGQLLSPFLPFSIDPILGLILSVWIMRNGIRSVIDTANPLLGEAPDPSLIEKIASAALAQEGILDIHDLLVHDYGPGMRIVSLHAEMDASMTLVQAHTLADRLEQTLKEKFDVDAVVHVDPKDITDRKVAALSRILTETAAGLNPSSSLHDFQMTQGDDGCLSISFDAVFPYEEKRSDEELTAPLREIVINKYPSCHLNIRIDRV